MKSPFSGEEGNGSAPAFAPFGVWTGGDPSARGGRDWCLSPPFPHLVVLHANPVSPRVTLGPNAPGWRFLTGAEGQIDGVLERWELEAVNYPRTQVPGRQAREEVWASVRGLRDPKLTTRSTCILVALSLGESRPVDTPRRAPQQVLNLPRALLGVLRPGGGPREVRAGWGDLPGQVGRVSE